MTNRDNDPARRIERLIGVDATNCQALKDIFTKHAEGHNPWPQATHILVPEEVHDRYINLYRLSVKLVYALYDVLEDSEHELVLEEAAELGYSLPDIEIFRQELDAYRDFLFEIDAYEGTLFSGGYVKVPRELANAFHNMAHYNCVIVSRVFEDCLKTDYMKHFGTLKRAGYPYVGATALQETMDVLVSLLKTANEIDRQVEAGRQRKDWPSLVLRYP